MIKSDKEGHRINRSGWLRAAVLGANDGILSTASLIVGVAAAQSSREAVLVAGIAGLVAGAMSMAAGEYVSVSSQADTEQADIAREVKELKGDLENEHRELTSIYVDRGLDPLLAKQVAKQLMSHDALGTHVRDELGITPNSSARPIQAALASAASFAFGAIMPIITVFLVSQKVLIPIIFITTLIFLAALGVLGAFIGGAPKLRAAVRVTFWGALAMVITAVVGVLFGRVG